MPFDGIDAFDNHPLAKLGAVEHLLATEQQWCKGRLRDAHGRHCLVGAIEAVGGRPVLQKVVLQAAISEMDAGVAHALLTARLRQ